MNAEALRVVLVTAPNREVATGLAHRLVQDKLAACVNVLPGIRSIFAWQGTIEDAEEVLLLVKTTADRWPALEETILREHPYEVPEILALTPSAGLDAYCRWVAEETTQ
ncbi:MAG: divalent-cation tolerance protein CutA [Bdellovibrionales bacterium]|nr:divalent-cation tolerance protein CutA [Bdellovibrionales bacterium]